jgi:hypothetical protein
LQKHFIVKGLANKNFLTRNFFMLQMNLLNIMGQHVNVLGAMAEELDVNRFGILDEVKVMVLFISLLNSYQHLIIALESLKP